MTDRPALWGGHECTVNRVGDVWRDQTLLTGHQDRIDDLDAFAGLGVTALRYPVLWERTEIRPGHWDWTWCDARLDRIRSLGMRPIAGLIHHGSGPAWTDLLDEGFALGLARHAGETARRFPWILDWTPVNEPLTTARFSALYGLWHPHRTDEASFWLALLNQIDATRLAMKAIRAVIPDARLIQTEDFGRTTGTTACASQARFENDRRLMTWDLLCGRVGPAHPLYERLAGLGFATRLETLLEDPCPPDVIGMNHYVTSDRFLDHRLDRYPAATHGGNGDLAYADVEAVRALPTPAALWTDHLLSLAHRYALPVAVTECHLAAEPDDQIAWFEDCWRAAVDLRRTGIAIEAVTSWSLVGAVDWDSLLTRTAGRYEPGAFAVTPGGLISGSLAAHLRHRSETDGPRGVDGSGWWTRDERRCFFPEEDAPSCGLAA